MGASLFVVLLDSHTFKSLGEGKEIDLRSNPAKKHIKNEKKKVRHKN
jgi:hypothetical protein